MLSLRSLFGTDAAVLRDTNFQVLILAMTTVPLGNGLVSPVLDSLLGPFGASAANIGLMISFFWAPSVVVVPLAGVLSDRYGRKSVLVPAILLFGAAGVAIAATTDFRLVLVLRLLQGVGWAGIAPVIATTTGDLYTGATEATAQGLRITGAGVLGSAVPLLAGGLVGLAWQFPFLLYAAAFPIAAAVYLWFDEPPSTTGEGADGGRESASYLRALFALVRQPRVLGTVVARGLPLGVWVAFITYNSIIVVQLLGGTPLQAGVLYAISSLVFALSASQAGRVTAQFASRYRLVIGGNLCLGAGFAATVLAPTVTVAALGITLAAVGFGVVVPVCTSIITGLAPTALRGGLVSASVTGSRVVGTTTPVVLGAVISVATPTLGFGPAVQAAGLGAAAVGAGGSILCLVAASLSPPVAGGSPASLRD